MACKQIDVDELFTDYVDAKILNLKEQVKLKKREINTKFQDIVKTILEQQNRILEEIDTIFDEVHTHATEQKLKIARLSERKAKFQNATNQTDETNHKQIQLEIQEVKNEAKCIPEISVNWNLDGLTKQLNLICEIKTEFRPYAYLEKIKCDLYQSNASFQYAPKTFEIDWPTGDIYFLTNYEDKYNFSFTIIAFDRSGNKKMVENGDWRCLFERKFCPIGMCLNKNSIFVSASGKSANKQYATLPKEIRSNPVEYKEYILKIRKSNGTIESTFPMKEIDSIGQILFEPQDENIYVLDHKKSCLNMFNLELELIRILQLPERKAGWITSAPSIIKIELVESYFFIFYNQPPHITVCNLSADIIRQLFDTIPEITTIDRSQNILTVEKKTNQLQVWNKNGKAMMKISNRLDVVSFQPIGLKFDILSGRLLYCGFSSTNTDGTKNKLTLVYL